MTLLSRFFIFAALMALLTSSARAGAILEGDTGDAMIDQHAVNDTSYSTFYDFNVGTLWATDIGTMVDAFPLPYLAPGQQVTGATASFYLEQINASPSYNIQLYGLNRVSSTNPVPLESDWYEGTNDTANTLLDAKFVTPSSTQAQAATYSGANLVSFIQKQYANAAFSGMDMSKTRYIFFRISPDGNGSAVGWNNYQFGSTRNPNRAYHPTLALTISNGISNVAGRLQFSFNLPNSAITSAGVYNTTTGVLLRTLWNNIQYQAGTNYGVWDGKDDSGAAVATGTPYQVRLIYHNVQYIWEGTIGNTSASQSGMNVYRSYLAMYDMAIAGGNGYYAVGYNELEDPFHTFAVGVPQVSSQIQTSFNDPFSCFTLVAADATRTYWAKGPTGINAADTYIVSITNSTGAFYAFPKGTALAAASNQKGNYGRVADFDATANQANPASGIAVQQSGNDLFVSHSNLNVVRVFDKVQGNLLGSFAVTNPGRLATTANGDVWVISNATPPVVSRYTFANGAATLKKTITGLTAPVGLGVSADDSLLLVADGGASQQIKAFNNSTGVAAWTYGQLGGMAVNGPNVTNNCFDFTAGMSSTYITFQADNTFWIGDKGVNRAIHFSINGNALSYIEQIMYNQVSYRATVDVTDATRVFNTFLEYSVNYALPLGGTNGSWTLVRNWAYGLPSDATHNYTGTGAGWMNVITLSNGHTYGFLNNSANNNWDLFELSASGPARSTGYSFNSYPRMYPDGTLRYNITGSSTLSFYSQPLTGFDAKNNPVWGSPALLATTTVTGTDPANWSAFPERSEMTAGGTVVNYQPYQGATGYHLGGIHKGGTAWQWRASPSTSSTYSLWFPQDGRFDIGNGVQYAGDYAMALGRNIVCGYHGEFWKGGQASQWMNFLDNGLMVGRFGTYEWAGQQNTVNGFCGNSVSPTLVHAANGNTYLYSNDESNHAGTVRWRIAGWDEISEERGTGSVGGITSLTNSSAGPTITITSPTPGAAYYNGGTVAFSAEAAGTGASLSSVQFFDGSTNLGTVSVAPYNLPYSGLSAGTHVITAKATDSSGLSTTSAAVSITVGGEGQSAPPPAPTSLASNANTAQSVSLNWVQPTIGTTSSTIGQMISYQGDISTDSNALPTSAVAGAPSYAVANWNLLGQSNNIGQANPLNSLGVVIPNLDLDCTIAYSSGWDSLQNLTGTALKLFGAEVKTTAAAGESITIGSIPYASYDLVVYSLPSQISTGSKTAFVAVSDNIKSSTVQQTFTAQPSGYTVSNVAFGSSTSVTNIDTVVFQGLTSSSFNLTGGNIAGFQIVERPYDKGLPASYNIQRASGTSGNFVTVGTVSAPALSYTDTSSISGSTSYQYRVEAVNSYGTSYSNVISVTTSSSGSAPVTAPVIPPVTTPVVSSGGSSSGFGTWQSKYFTSAQLADPTISGATADPYGSGISNLLAYALQLNPATATPADVPTPSIINGHLTMTYFVPSSITDINFIPEVSPDLLNWNSGSGYVEVLSNVSSASGNTITVQDTLPATTQTHFMHLRVTQLP